MCNKNVSEIVVVAGRRVSPAYWVALPSPHTRLATALHHTAGFWKQILILSLLFPVNRRTPKPMRVMSGILHLQKDGRW